MGAVMGKPCTPARFATRIKLTSSLVRSFVRSFILINETPRGHRERYTSISWTRHGGTFYTRPCEKPHDLDCSLTLFRAAIRNRGHRGLTVRFVVPPSSSSVGRGRVTRVFREFLLKFLRGRPPSPRGVLREFVQGFFDAGDRGGGGGRGPYKVKV